MTRENPLRARLEQGLFTVAPGAADALTARIVQAHGFDAVYMTGLGATAMRLGKPDLGLMTQTEMADHARAMVRAVDIPVIADADTGYGGALNVARTVREYLQGGVAAMHIEDQVSPKRCGQLSGIRLVPAEEAAARLSAAVEARGSEDIVLIGRTDALPGQGMDEAVRRAARYRDAGVDLVFVDGVKTRAEVEQIAARVEGPKVLSLVDGTDAAELTVDEVREMGFSVVMYAVTGLFAAARATADAMARLKSDGRPGGGAALSYAGFCDVVDLQAHQAFAHRHGE
ncbi:isocitrate lyase/PEP mutase family protein [Alloyangia pacifica]|uniref:2-Methylisocitrate lyase, PEP mutase family n=1 Tax=Alloyangia pacifica TaxID=311180 RepID=A0A1I6WGQ0_9RHOB|nr:isocitrate lyase/PEP mutase family protein [Alloyangia pacifica]SDI74275.1 2-Methylisocitrate lyase, PEP mutase family [Alloyangia pacifica]SFT25178.1 2-Methylisocitrate lyase, PEP mutase family [Alloyangia pacifica]